MVPPFSAPAPVFQDTVDRYLIDAEAAATSGDRDLALELIALALDTAPGDPTVLMRAYAIRSPLADRMEGGRREKASFLGEPEAAPAVVTAAGNDQGVEAELTLLDRDDSLAPGSGSAAADVTVSAWELPPVDAARALDLASTAPSASQRPAPRVALPRPLLYGAWGTLAVGLFAALLIALTPGSLTWVWTLRARLFVSSPVED